MLRSNKYIIASLSLAVLLAACGGGGGGGSNAETNNPSTENVVSLVSSLTSSNSVTAGTSYSITATLSQGNSSTVNFANSTDTPSTVTYSPNSCSLTSSNNKCTVQVNVGLSTIPTDGKAIYATNVSYTNSSYNFITQKISFAVAQPDLEIVTQPSSSLQVNQISSIGYTISSSVVPTGKAGSVNLTFTSSNSSAIAAPTESCVISYSESGEITPCSVHIKAINNAESVTITAHDSQHNFAAVTSNAITTTGSPFAVDTDGFTNSFGVYAGQEFEITVRSVAGATESVTFAGNEGTSGHVTITPPTCDVTPSNSCTAIVKVALSTPPTGNLQAYGINVIHSTGTQNVSFGVQAPILIVESAPNPGTIYVNGVPSSSSVKYTIESSAVPAGTGSINVALSSSNTSAATVNSSCTIGYAAGIATGCSSTINAASSNGSATIKAAATYFESANAAISVIDQNAEFNVHQPSNKVYAGQSFNIQVTLSQNTTATVKFAPDNSNLKIQTDQQNNDLCTLNQTNNTCIAKVLVPLNTTAQSTPYKIVITDTTTGKTISTQEITVVKPTLAVYGTLNNYLRLGGENGNIGYTIPSGQIPTIESGSITVDLTSSGQGVSFPFNIRSTCIISYDTGVITNLNEPGSCNYIDIRGNSAGISQVTASSNILLSATASVYVAKNVIYTLSPGVINTFANLGDNALRALPTTLDGGSQFQIRIVAPGQMAMIKDLSNLSVDRLLLIPDADNNTLNAYEISKKTGKPASLKQSIALQDPSVNSNTISVKFPTEMVIAANSTSSKKYVYVLNHGPYGSMVTTVNRSISMFSVNENGVLAHNGMVTFPKLALNIPAFPTNSDHAMAVTTLTNVSPNDYYVYVAVFADPKGIGYNIVGYRVNATGGLDYKKSTAMPDGKAINSIATSPDGKWLAVGTEDTANGGNSRIYIYSINKSNGDLSQNKTFPITKGLQYNVFFSPDNILYAVIQRPETGSLKSEIAVMSYTNGSWSTTFNYYSGLLNKSAIGFSTDSAMAYTHTSDTRSINMTNIIPNGSFGGTTSISNDAVLLQILPAPNFQLNI